MEAWTLSEKPATISTLGPVLGWSTSFPRCLPLSAVRETRRIDPFFALCF